MRYLSISEVLERELDQALEKLHKLFLLQLFIITILAWSMPWLAFSKNKGITEDERARLQDSEIIWPTLSQINCRRCL